MSELVVVAGLELWPLPDSEGAWVSNAARNPCALCGKNVFRDRWWIHVVAGGGRVLAAADEGRWPEPESDLGFLPVGSECRRSVPARFLHDGLPG